MSNKNTEDKKEGVTPPIVVDASVEEVPAFAVKARKCGHINRHFINADGVREDLKCVLDAGHEGDHSAPYKCLRPADGSIAQARAIATGSAVLKLSGRMVGNQFVKNDYVEVEEIGYWSDAAGTPVEHIKPDTEQLKRIKAKKGDMLDAAQLERNTVRLQ